MKKITLLCLFLSSLPVHADTVITESVDHGGKTMTMTMKLKGDKIRMDATPQMSTIMDASNGDSLTLLHSQKGYMKISGSQAKAIQEQMKKMQGQAVTGATPTEKPKPVDTGKSEKVNNYNARIYTLDTPGSHITLWLTKDIPNYALLTEQFKKLSTVSNFGASTTASPETSDPQGFPVKTEIVNGKGETTTITVTSVEEKSIDDAEMSPPSGYTEISMPNPGTQGSRPARP